MAVTIENVKFSNIDLAFIKDYLRVDYEDDDKELELYLISAKSYIMEHSDKTSEELDNIGYSPICLIKLVSDMYNHRNATVDNTIKQDMVFGILMSKIRSYNLGEIL